MTSLARNPGGRRSREVLLQALLPILMVTCTGASGGPARDGQAADYVDPRAAICATGNSASPTFDVVQQIFNQNCIACHTTGADLDLSPGLARGNLVGRPAPPAESCGGTLVVAGNADASYLYQKISSDNPCSGARMPRGDIVSQPLPDCVTALVRNWIATGAAAPASDAGND